LEPRPELQMEQCDQCQTDSVKLFAFCLLTIILEHDLQKIQHFKQYN